MQSNEFFIHPKYNLTTHNFDICLIKTTSDINGIYNDLSASFEAIPCQPENFELEKVRLFHFYSKLNFHLLLIMCSKLSLGTWKSMLGCWLGFSAFKWGFC